MRISSAILIFAAPALLGGCVASAVVDTVTLPARAVSKTVSATSQVADWATTSQDEADREVGRQQRRDQAKERKRVREAWERCKKQNYDNC